MELSIMFVDCPAYLDDSGSVRCGLPAEVEGRYTMRSTDGPLESARIRCPRGHWFNGPVDSLTLRPIGHALTSRSAYQRLLSQSARIGVPAASKSNK
jgi:hypothetical protein